MEGVVKIQPCRQDARTLLPLLDLTTLRGDESRADITVLCQRAGSALGHVAAVCVYPQLAKQTYNILQAQGTNDIAVACVANFPSGRQTLPVVLAEISTALDAGAREIDLVFPYFDFLSAKQRQVHDFIATCVHFVQGQAELKVILETGAYPDQQSLAQACALSIQAGAHWLKTSTGKHEISVTPSAVRVMLAEIRASRKKIGFKVAGGIQSLTLAWDYISLVETILGKAFICAQSFRIGTSRLWDVIYAATAKVADDSCS